MNKEQKNNRQKLKENKPLVYEKIMKYPKMPRIQYQCLYECNFHCDFCSINKLKNNNKQKLTNNQIRDLFNEADEIGISRITITGGEPLILGKKLDELIKIIDSSRFWVQLDTNALLLTKEKVQHLKDIGIDCIAPSLDSLNFEEHDNARNYKGSAEKVIKVFDYIQEIGLNTFVQTIVGRTRLYSGEFIKFIEYFNNRNIGIYVGFCKPVGAFEGHFEELIDKNDLKYMEKLEKKYKVFTHLTPAYGINEERYCVASRNIFAISAYGDVFPCIFFFASMGNVTEEPLKDILKRCQSLKPFKKQTCVVADKTDEFIDKYLVKKVYGKKLPINWKKVFTEEDFD